MPQWMMGRTVRDKASFRIRLTWPQLSLLGHQVKIKLALPAWSPASCGRRDRFCRCQLRVPEGLAWDREAPSYLLESL